MGVNNMDKTHNPYIAMTIERQLKIYAECENHTERHEVLWHEWNHNKRWLMQVQEMILPSFPSYSKHDVSHSESVLHNIEMLLGDDNIRQLSPTDCFAILHTVFIHDIGMCITHSDRENILQNDRFHEFLKQVSKNNSNLKYYANVLLEECFGKKDNLDKKNNCENADKEKKNKLLLKKLDVYYAIIYMIAEFRRMEHGDVSRERLEEWINKPDKLGIGFSPIEVPSRIFYMIANCASTHTKWDFQAVMDLPHRDTGYAHDYMHPRFIAVMLQLGDALDMDNDRFHPITLEYLGGLPAVSKIHYNKHKSVRVLKITNEEIEIKADCEGTEELRLIRSECDCIRDILSKASRDWVDIKPHGSNMCLPTFNNIQLLLNGLPIPQELVEARFNISQEKAFQLIEGNNIYKNEGQVFLRELLQNALDASKIQYFRDLKNILGRDHKKMPKEPETANAILPLKNYPVRIELSIRKYRQNQFGEEKCLELSKEDVENPKQLDDYECGVLVRVRDFATGISGSDIRQITDVGSSYSSKATEINSMPEWLKPTGEFGVGLQSAFLAGSKLRAITHTRKDEHYEIEFYPRHEGGNGHINVMPIANAEKAEPYGTCFEIFVPNDKRRFHKESPLTWDGEDPFEKGYGDRRKLRHAIELAQQMVHYLNKISGAVFLPIGVTIYIPHPSILYKNGEKLKLRKRWNNWDVEMQHSDIDVKIVCNNRILWSCNRNNILPWENNADENLVLFTADNGDRAWFDLQRMRMFVWCNENSTMGCFGVRELLKFCRGFRKDKNPNIKIPARIYYKGMYVSERRFTGDSNLLEYIDVKKKLDRDYLKLNRDGFSQSGVDFLDTTYQKLLKIANEMFAYMNKKNNEEYIDKIISNIKECADMVTNSDNKMHKEASEELYEKIFGITALSYFGLIEKSDESYVDSRVKLNTNWNKLIKSIQECFNPNIKRLFQNSILFNFPCIDYKNNILLDKDKKISILDFVDTQRRYFVISERNSKRDMWTCYLVEAKDTYNKIKKLVKELRSEHVLKNRKVLINAIEDIGIRIFQDFSNSNKEEEFSGEILNSSYQMLMKWILTNIPTLALLSSEDEKIRINILDHEVCDSVYCDAITKKLTLKRMLEQYNEFGYERFSTISWTGYGALKLDNKYLSVQFVKRGKLARLGYGEMLIPLAGRELKKIMDLENLRFDLVDENLTEISENEENQENGFSPYSNLMKKYLVFKAKIIAKKQDGNNIDIDKESGEMSNSEKVSEFEYKALIRRLFDDLSNDKSDDSKNMYSLLKISDINIQDMGKSNNDEKRAVNMENLLTNDLACVIINEIISERKNQYSSSIQNQNDRDSYKKLLAMAREELLPVQDSAKEWYIRWKENARQEFERNYKSYVVEMEKTQAYNNMVEYITTRSSYITKVEQVKSLYRGLLYEMIYSVYIIYKNVNRQRVVSDFEEVLDGFVMLINDNVPPDEHLEK